MPVAVKRVYEAVSRTDGSRVLVDRLWPRGLTKAQAQVDEWLRKLAPSNELRKWFHAQPSHWLTFRKKYLKELSRHPEADIELRKLYALAHKKKRLTLLLMRESSKSCWMECGNPRPAPVPGPSTQCASGKARPDAADSEFPNPILA